MIELTVALADGATIYVPAPCRCTLSQMTAVFQSSDVAANDTIKAYRNTSCVNTITAANTAGLVVETGVPDATYKDLVFDPTSSTATEQVVKIISGSESGSAAAIVKLRFDDGAYVQQTAKEA